MKKVIIIILSIVIVLALAILGTAGYYGAFTDIQINKKNPETKYLVYAKHLGDYSKIGPVMDKVYADLKKEKINTVKGFGLYYDNPAMVKAEKLRSIGGCILENSDTNKIELLKSKGLKVVKYQFAKSIVAEFPYKGAMSFMFGVIKVYPKLQKYIQTNKVTPKPIMEIYDKPNEKIEYILSYEIPDTVYAEYLK